MRGYVYVMKRRDYSEGYSLKEEEERAFQYSIEGFIKKKVDPVIAVKSVHIKVRHTHTKWVTLDKKHKVVPADTISRCWLLSL